MEELKQILVVMGVGIPSIVTIGLFMLKKMITMSEDISFLKGIHHELDKNNK